MEGALETIRACRIVAVLRAGEPTYLGTVVDTLVAAGVRAVEIALTTPGALPALDTCAATAPDPACLGPGTLPTATNTRSKRPSRPS